MNSGIKGVASRVDADSGSTTGVGKHDGILKGDISVENREQPECRQGGMFPQGLEASGPSLESRLYAQLHIVFFFRARAST